MMIGALELSLLAFSIRIVGLALCLAVLSTLSFSKTFMLGDFSLGDWFSRQKKGRITLSIVVLAVLLRASTLFVISESDEPFYLFISRLVAEGKRPYIDFFTPHPPGYFLVTAFIFGHAGVGVFQAKVMPVIFSIMFFIFLHLLTKRFFGENEAVACLIMASVTPGLVSATRSSLLYSECLFFSVLSAYLYLTALRKDDGKLFLFAGFSAAIAVSYRLFGLYVFFAMIIHSISSRKEWKRIVLLPVGMFVVFSIFLAIFGMPFLGDVFFFNALERYGSSVPDIILSFITYVPLAYALPSFMALVWAHHLYSEGRMDEVDKFNIIWLGVVIAGTILMFNVIPRVYSIYLVMAVPPLLLLGCRTVNLKTPYILSLFLVFSIHSVAYDVSTILTDLSFGMQQDEIAAYIKANVPVNAEITGTGPYYQAAAFLTGRDVVLGLPDEHITNTSSEARAKYVGELKAKPIALLLEPSGIYVNDRILDSTGGRCVERRRFQTLRLFTCNI